MTSSTYKNSKLDRTARAVIGVIVISLVFGLQSYNVGFWAMPHALISHHVLAIFRHATPENRFAGYAQQWTVAEGEFDYEYFERTPPFFSAAMHIGLRLAPDNLADNIFASRQMMNVIFVAMLFGLWLLARRFVSNPWLAIAAVLLATASYHELYYKDMINYDQPAILGMVGLLLAIAHYKLDGGKRWIVTVAGIVAVSLGFGFPSFFVLGLWGLIELVRNVQERRRLLSGDIPFITRVVVIGLVWSAAFVVNNVTVEAQLREVPITETSVVQSAIRRMPFLSALREEEDATTLSDELESWGQFLVVQYERLALWTVPFRLAGDMRWGFTPGSDTYNMSVTRLAITTVTVVAAGVFIARQRHEERDIAILLAFSGLAFMLFMKDFTVQHTYVTMYSKGFVLAAFLGVFMWLDRTKYSRGAGYLLTVLALLIFAGGLWQVREVQSSQSENAVAYTRDFERIRATGQLQPQQAIFVAYPGNGPQCFITGNMCMAVGSHLPWNPITKDVSLAQYILTPQDYFVSAAFVDAGKSLELTAQTVTPDNEIMYMLDRAQSETRTAPEQNAPQTRFGDALTLQDWSLAGDVEVAPCERRVIESWWLADDVPVANYNMQVVMVGADGSAVTDANAPLTTVPTTLWEVDRFTLDARGITVPCGTPPGEYPLIMGAYHPDTLEPLQARGADGEIIGNQLYLTTLFVK
ncbi:MAG: hypothetical protein AAFR56_11890 [Chloroflexota bacterium]